jgi:hypothetical protein
MARPRLAERPRLVQIKLRLYRGMDDDLIRFFASVPPRLRATMVKQALRSGVSSDSTLQDDFLDALDNLVSGSQ